MENSEKLFAAILQTDFAAADKMIAAGVTLGGDIREALVKGPSSAANFVLSRYNYHKQFMDFAAHASAEDFAAVAEKLFGLVGEPLYNTFGEYRYGDYKNVFYDPVFFEALLKYCNGKQMRKQMTMREIIDRNNVELLEMCAKYGWLKTPRIRDAIIEYSQAQNRTECTAWLLDFKNRTADLAAERERAEKRMLRELNADPNSVTEQKKLWNFEQGEDGNLIITGYKGKRTEIAVPSMIGESVVTAIGANAFSSFAPRLRREQRVLRDSITKIILPDTIKAIGANAFNGCSSLSELNIPDGVTEIGDGAFNHCESLCELVIPKSVKVIGEKAFTGCQALQTAELPDGITVINDYTFSGCRGLKSVSIPSSVQTIGKWAFGGCDALEALVIPEGVTEIGAQPFRLCTALKSVTLPASVKKIKNFKYRDTAPVHIFHGLPDVTVTVEPKSYAEKYCKRNGIKYIYKENR